MQTHSIPITVGVTGHRSIPKEAEEALTAAVTNELERLLKRCPHSRIVMLNSLAEGGDQLCARAAQALSIPLIAALPLEREEYEKDFQGDAKEAFCALYDRAEACLVVPQAEAQNGMDARDFAYRQAGVYVASHAHVLLALWDGEEGTSGCGAAETVRFMTDGAFAPADGAFVKTPGFVIHVFAPRGGFDGGQSAGAVRYLGDEEAFLSLLDRTDEFNRLAEGTASDARLLPPDAEPDPTETLYGAADALSMRSGKRYRAILAALAAVSTVITAAFLLYDEAELHGMILVCGGMLLAAWIMLHYGRRTASHRRYLEYRTLAESLRVQTFLRYAGSDLCVSRLLPWSAQVETAWVVRALDAVTLFPSPRAPHPIRSCWVEKQRLYHENALIRSNRAVRGSERVVGIALRVSIALYLLVLAYELLLGGLLPLPWALSDPEPVRTLAKLLLGSISAATLFIANYYGKLAPKSTASTHEKMARFYLAVRNRLDRQGQTEELLTLLAREELAENANWCAEQRDNGIDFSL